ncbi:MAG: M4 family metallopeptidase, partial [Saprospiraceae bacterium]
LCNLYSSNCDSHESFSPTGAETATATDLLNISQTINVWREGNTYYLIDASKPMFNSAMSKFPDNVIGGLITLDGKGRSIEDNSFGVDFISSSNNTWPSKTSISAHLNGSKAYEYFRQVHIRNSIDGAGGSVMSIINVNDANGSMDNAFWNGEAMFYGNGKQAFTPLAKGLDVAGHEMSHGVIGSTANLSYQSESGAINESYADVFGAMIDRDDWKIGEDVVITSVFRSGALRDLSDPHNGGNSLSDNGYQPRHVNEQYNGTQDNGGVHINSGIPNYAFFTFVTEMAKSRTLEAAKQIGEKVYYCALTKYLTRSSNFKDLRNAIERCCTELFSSSPDVLASAKIGFDKVGINSTTGGGGTNLGNRVLSTNSGKQYLVCSDQNLNGVYLYDFQNAPIQLSNRDIISKPSVTDNGAEIYYVGKDKRLYGLFLNKSTGQYVEQEIDNDPIYRNAVISKDGLLIAVLFDVEEKFIHIFDFDKQKWGDFKLYNPSYSNTTTGDVRYADVMDFDHSGQFLMYDAFNVIKTDNGQDYEYWDIGFMNVFSNASVAFGDGKIQKLVSSLPENVIIGNPVFSKNSLDVIAFDYIEGDATSNKLTLVGSNIETNDFQAILQDRPVVSFSNYSVKDDRIIFDGENQSGDPSINTVALAANKIQSNGSEQVVLNGAKWGVWFATGVRKLTINTKNFAAISSFDISPNPFIETLTLE